MRSITTLNGNSQKLDGGAMFGNAPKALWQRWIQPDELNRIELGCRAVLVQEPGRNVLIETGVGAFFSPDMRERYGVQEAEHVLLDELAKQDLSEQDIDIVVLTHLHFDHAGGLLSAWSAEQEPQLLFPNATYIVGAEQWQRANNPHARDRASYIPELHRLLEQSGRLQLVETGATEHELLGEGWRLHWSNGHTPGLMLPEVSLQDGPVVYTSDLIPGAPWVHLPITMGYDRFAEALIEEKQELLSDLVARNGRIVFTHDAKVAIGNVVRDEKGRYSVNNQLENVTELTR